MSNPMPGRNTIGRSVLPGSGTFISVPVAFKGAPKSLASFVKFQFTTAAKSGSHNPSDLVAVVAPDRLLLDFGAIDESVLNTKKLARDCEIVREAALKRPAKLKELLGIYAGNATPTPAQVHKSVKIVQDLGLSEVSTLAAGGGLLFLLIIAVACMTGCAHCNPYVKRDK